MQPIETYTDNQLLQLLNNGDENAFTTIYRRYWDTLYSNAFHILEDDAACLDVLQEVFVWLWENRKTVSVTSLKPYLCTAVKFKMLNVIRRGKICNAAIQHYKSSGASFSYVENSIEVKELKMMIDRFIESLPEQAGKIFQLSRNEQLSHREIAHRLNLSEKTVRNQINGSLKKLKATLGHLSCWTNFFL